MRVFLLLLFAAPLSYAQTVTVRNCSEQGECSLAIEGEGLVTLELADGRFDWVRVNGSVAMTDPALEGNNDGIESTIVTVQAPILARFDVDGAVFSGGAVTSAGRVASFVADGPVWTAQLSVEAEMRAYTFVVEPPSEWENGEPLNPETDLSETIIYCTTSHGEHVFRGEAVQVHELAYGTWRCDASVVSVDGVESDRSNVIMFEVGPEVRPGVPMISAEAENY